MYIYLHIQYIYLYLDVNTCIYVCIQYMYRYTIENIYVHIYKINIYVFCDTYPSTACVDVYVQAFFRHLGLSKKLFCFGTNIPVLKRETY